MFDITATSENEFYFYIMEYVNGKRKIICRCDSEKMAVRVQALLTIGQSMIEQMKIKVFKEAINSDNNY